MKVRNLNTRPPRVEMLPLIDVVFLLLVVFIYTMLSMAVHKGLPVDLPVGQQVKLEKETPVSVSVTASGEVFVNKTAVPLEELTTMLTALSGGDSQSGVLLFADKQVPYERVFEVLDRIHQAGLYRISLQAETGARP
jgi:biopolymer transport protein ExbD